MSRLCLLALAAAFILPTPALADLPSDEDFARVKGKLKFAIRSGSHFLLDRYDPKKRTWGHPGIDALVLVAIVRSPDGSRYSDEDPFIRGPIDALIEQQADNGSISHQGMLANYITSVVVLALVELQEREMITVPARAARVKAAITRARDYLIEQPMAKSRTHPHHGGVGYGGGDGRPDLSNTQLTLEALRKAGVGADNPAVKRALEFLKRCQNRSESNDQDWAADDGGFVYQPGESAAGKAKTAAGEEYPRSYGSMTYAGVKAFIHAGLSWDDPMVKAAMGWIKANYTVEQHPGLGTAGQYYYFHTFAKAMALWSAHSGTRRLTAKEGATHDWAYDLSSRLLSLQREDGSWVNSNGRWMEGQPVLATTYAVLALNYCYPLKAEKTDKAPK